MVEREKEGCASSNPIVLVTLKEPSMPEHDTVEYVFYIFSKHRRPVRSRRSMAIHNATAYLSAKRGGGRGGIGRTRERERERKNFPRQTSRWKNYSALERALKRSWW